MIDSGLNADQCKLENAKCPLHPARCERRATARERLPVASPATGRIEARRRLGAERSMDRQLASPPGTGHRLAPVGPGDPASTLHGPPLRPFHLFARAPANQQRFYNSNNATDIQRTRQIRTARTHLSSLKLSGKGTDDNPK